MKLAPPTCLLALLISVSASAAEEKKLRDLAPDRPDTTESPQTVDKGHFQLEMTFADFTRNAQKGSDRHSHTWAFADTNMKFGLTESDDIQFVMSPYGYENSGMPRDRTDGASPLTIRWKHNFWGNDEGDTAFALMPFVVLPTGSDLSGDHVEGGLIAPLSWTPEWAEERNLGFCFMLEGDAVWDDDKERYDGVLVHTATCGFGIGDTPFGGFVEYVGELYSSGDDYTAYGDAGITYSVNDNMMFDIGTRLGLTDASDELGFFVGMTFRY
jgi:Putative MetA-pathway of phenol degradation